MKHLHSVLFLWIMFIPSIHAETSIQDAEEQYVLGTMYLNGEGIESDILLGAEWLRKAAEQGHIHAQYTLGMAYDQIYDVGNKDIAIKWFRMAAEKGHLEAQHRLEEIINEQEALDIEEGMSVVDLLDSMLDDDYDSSRSLSDIISGK